MGAVSAPFTNRLMVVFSFAFPTVQPVTGVGRSMDWQSCSSRPRRTLLPRRAVWKRHPEPVERKYQSRFQPFAYKELFVACGVVVFFHCVVVVDDDVLSHHNENLPK